MASTYSPNLRLELIGTGEQQGTWGVTTNTNLGTLLEEAIGGYTSVTVTDGADTTLTTNNGSADQSRNMVINLTGALTAARNVICPAIEKMYVVKNATTGGQAVTFKVSGQTGVSIPNGSTYILYVNGTDAALASGTIAAQNSNNVSITGGSLSGITSITVAAGSNTAPSITTTGDTNTGIYFPAADTIAFTEGGTEAMRIDSSGNVGIGTSALSNFSFRVAKNITGATSATGILSDGTIQSDVTSIPICVSGLLRTAAASFTISDAQIYRAATAASLGAGSSITRLYGYLAGDLTAGTTNYGFFTNATAANVTTGKTYIGFAETSNVATGGGTSWAFYASGTAPNYFNGQVQLGAGAVGTPSIAAVNDTNTGIFFPAADTIAFSKGGTEAMRIRSDGNVGIGGTGAVNHNLFVQSNITGSSFARAIVAGCEVQSTVTNASSFFSQPSVVAASFTLGALSHFLAEQSTFGAGSTVTTQAGFNSGTSIIGGTNNYAFLAGNTAAVTSGKTAYGFFSNINTATGGGTTWGFYAAGTATNYFGGQVQLAAGSATTTALAASNDANTGIFFPAADTVAMSTGGTERMRIDASGNVGIGTSTFGTSAATVLAIATGTAPSTGPADTIQIFSTDLSAGNTILSLRTEGTPVNANTTAAATHRIAVRINGTVYYLLANTAA